MGTIELNDMIFYARHGHYEVENKVGGQFRVQVKLAVDCTCAGETDNLDDALNYQLAYDVVKREMAIPSALLEHVCTRILSGLKALPKVESAWVKVEKMNPPMGGEMMSVSVAMGAPSNSPLGESKGIGREC
ncbi:MAG: dihydroneopterin aldolase [Mangrovibacterium sp.]